MVYVLKHLRDLCGRPFVCEAMGNLLRLDVDVDCVRGDREEIEVGDMAHLEAQVRFVDALTDENIDRSDATWARLRAGIYPEARIDPREIGPLRACRLRRPGARAAWLKAAKIRAKKSLATRGHRIRW